MFKEVQFMKEFGEKSILDIVIIFKSDFKINFYIVLITLYSQQIDIIISHWLVYRDNYVNIKKKEIQPINTWHQCTVSTLNI